MIILVLGVTGMLGNAMFRVFAQDSAHTVYGTARQESALAHFPELAGNILTGVDVTDDASLAVAFEKVKPDMVINCVGVVKQLASAEEPLEAIPINSLLPHRLAKLCKDYDARLVHVSTDCVFSGEQGNYRESDFADADDLYGRSKFLGEVDYPHAITLRTSIIGRELTGARSLVGWFLSQKGPIKGFTKAIFSGLPTVELARIVKDVVLPRPELHGLYHVAAAPIDKFELLNLVAKTYQHDITINPDASLVIDRSLNADRFHAATGYTPPTWPELISRMHTFN